MASGKGFGTPSTSGLFGASGGGAPNFSFGTPAVGSGNSAPGFSFGGTPVSTVAGVSTSGGGKPGVAATVGSGLAVSSSGASSGGLAGLLATPGAPSSSGLLTGLLGTQASTTTTSSLPFASGLGSGGPGVAGLKLGSTPVTQAVTGGAGFSAPRFAATSTTIGGLGIATSSTPRPSVAGASSNVPNMQMNYRQLEDQINKWMTELEEQERLFLQQATQVNAQDRLLMENGEKISQLNGDMERVTIDQNKLEQELEFIKSQQTELEELLIPMERSLEQLPSVSFQPHADLERENTYQLADNIDAQLKRMMQDLKEIIDHLNTSNTTQDTSDPILQITKILNAHMDSLQWIDTNSALLFRRVEDISKQMESQRKDQERNFRLAYE